MRVRILCDELLTTICGTVEFLASKQKVTPSLLLDKVILGLSPGDFAEAFRRGVDKETAARMAWNAGGKR